jgi:four helix bundle protein
MAVHVRRALGSANEVDDQLESLRELGSLRSTDLWLIDEVREIRSMLASLLRRLEADIAQKRHTRRKKRKS